MITEDELEERINEMLDTQKENRYGRAVNLEQP